MPRRGLPDRPASAPSPLPGGSGFDEDRPSRPVLRDRTGHLEPVFIEGAYFMMAPDGRTYPLRRAQRVDVAVGDGFLRAVLALHGDEWWVEFDFAGLAGVPLAHRTALTKMSRRSGAVRMAPRGPGIVFQLPVASLRDRMARLVD